MKKTDIKYSVDDDVTLEKILETVNAFVYKFHYNDEATITKVKYSSDNVDLIFNISKEEYIKRINAGNLNELFHPN